MTTIYDIKTSFNNYIKDQLALYDSNINVFFQPNQNICYPAVIVRHPFSGEYTRNMFEFTNVAEFNVIYTGSNDRQATLTCQEIYNIFNFNSRRTVNFIQIPIYDYTTGVTPLADLGCMRVYIEEGSGYRYIPSEDPNIRHYQIDLTLKYKI